MCARMWGTAAPTAVRAVREQDSNALPLTYCSILLLRGARSNPILTEVYNALLRKRVLDPRTSKLLGRWDLCTMSALGFTTFVTPVEVALLSNVRRRGLVIFFWSC